MEWANGPSMQKVDACTCSTKKLGIDDEEEKKKGRRVERSREDIIEETQYKDVARGNSGANGHYMI